MSMLNEISNNLDKYHNFVKDSFVHTKNNRGLINITDSITVKQEKWNNYIFKECIKGYCMQSVYKRIIEYALYAIKGKKHNGGLIAQLHRKPDFEKDKIIIYHYYNNENGNIFKFKTTKSKNKTVTITCNSLIRVEAIANGKELDKLKN